MMRKTQGNVVTYQNCNALQLPIEMIKDYMLLRMGK